MKKGIILIGAVLAGLTSCKTVSNFSYSEYKTLDLTQSAVIAPVLADLRVDSTRIKYAERINVNIRNMKEFEVNALVEKEKKTVIANALKSRKADVLVAPSVDVQTDAQGCLVISVLGYPAYYTNFRSITDKDRWILDLKIPAKADEKPVLLPILKKK